MSKACVPHMLERGGGSIISVAGMASHQGVPRRAHVMASKDGLIGLTRGLALDLGPQNIRANVVVVGVFLYVVGLRMRVYVSIGGECHHRPTYICHPFAPTFPATTTAGSTIRRRSMRNKAHLKLMAAGHSRRWALCAIYKNYLCEHNI